MKQTNKSPLILFSKDAKLGKKCTLLDLSRRPSIAAPDAQGNIVSSSETNSQDSSSLSKSTTNDLTSVEDLGSNERMEKETMKEEIDEEKTHELSPGESAAKMEVDPKESQSDEEQSMTECNLVSNSIVFMCGALFPIFVCPIM